nr:MAG TPA: hypothetical protein [Caudoviricetes sp.]
MSTTKIYKANTNVSINVVLPSKKNLHITFTPLSNGSSVFSTDNEVLQKAIERHYRFGSLFRLAEKYSVSKKSTDKDINNKTNPEPQTVEETEKSDGTAELPEKSDETTDEADNDSENNGLTKVHVTDIASAKDYLADKFGISRTSMRSTKSIIEQASANGIEFEGI